jgi:hypothetical protein
MYDHSRGERVKKYLFYAEKSNGWGENASSPRSARCDRAGDEAGAYFISASAVLST